MINIMNIFLCPKFYSRLLDSLLLLSCFLVSSQYNLKPTSYAIDSHYVKQLQANENLYSYASSSTSQVPNDI